MNIRIFAQAIPIVAEANVARQVHMPRQAVRALVTLSHYGAEVISLRRFPPSCKSKATSRSAPHRWQIISSSAVPPNAEQYLLAQCKPPCTKRHGITHFTQRQDTSPAQSGEVHSSTTTETTGQSAGALITDFDHRRQPQGSRLLCRNHDCINQHETINLLQLAVKRVNCSTLL